jgi:hypothetical protein
MTLLSYSLSLSRVTAHFGYRHFKSHKFDTAGVKRIERIEKWNTNNTHSATQNPTILKRENKVPFLKIRERAQEDIDIALLSCLLGCVYFNLPK